MSLLGPFSKGFPVAFRSDGDTTRDAFGKHIQEIDRIYGYLNALDAGKASADEISGSLGDLNTVLTQHINSSNPHPNWKPSFSFSDLSGTVDASKVSGKLTQATIDASRVNGLTALITGSIPEASGDGITSSSLAGNGYVKFKNGLIIQWGVVEATEENLVSANTSQDTWDIEYSYPTQFQSSCFLLHVRRSNSDNQLKFGYEIKSKGTSSFTIRYSDITKPQTYHTTLSYIAIGK